MKTTITLALLALGFACQPPAPPPPPPANVPQIVVVVPTETVQQVNGATIKWDAENAAKVVLNSYPVPATGSMGVTRAATYQFAVQGSPGQQWFRVRLLIGPTTQPVCPVLIAATDASTQQPIAAGPDGYFQVQAGQTVELQTSCASASP